MGVLLRLLMPSRVLKPLTRLLVGLVAIPLFRLLMRRVARVQELDAELEKDLEQWFRGSLLLLAATRNMEQELFGWVPATLDDAWLMGGRILLAIGVIEAMPDQDLFAIIHPGPRLKLQRTRLWSSLREQCRPLCKGLLCQHLNRSSPVFAILAAIIPGLAGWICFAMAVVQYLIIGLVTSRDRALDVLSEFDRQTARRREELLDGCPSRQDGSKSGSPSTASVAKNADTAYLANEAAVVRQ